MIIKSALFVKSSGTYLECPIEMNPEIAFVGRSNVGKSSLINMLLERKQLAKISQTPGKTQLINHYFVNNSWYLVDLPGYGWARASKSVKNIWAGMVVDYLLNRKQLSIVFVLIDSRLKPQVIDLEFIDWLGSNNVPLAVLFTKTDKESVYNIETNVSLFKKEVLKNWNELPDMMLTSAKTKMGKYEVHKYMFSVLVNDKKKSLL